MTVRPLRPAWRFSRNELSGKPGAVQTARRPPEWVKAGQLAVAALGSSVVPAAWFWLRKRFFYVIFAWAMTLSVQLPAFGYGAGLILSALADHA